MLSCATIEDDLDYEEYLEDKAEEREYLMRYGYVQEPYAQVQAPRPDARQSYAARPPAAYAGQSAYPGLQPPAGAGQPAYAGQQPPAGYAGQPPYAGQQPPASYAGQRGSVGYSASVPQP